MGFSNYLDYHRYQYLNNVLVLAAGTVINRSLDVTQKNLLQRFSLVVTQIHLLYCAYLVPPVTGSTRCLREKNKKISLKKTLLLQIHWPSIIPYHYLRRPWDFRYWENIDTQIVEYLYIKKPAMFVDPDPVGSASFAGSGSEHRKSGEKKLFL